MNKKVKEEVLSLLNMAYYFEESDSDYKSRINNLYEQLTTPVVSKAFYCLEGGIKGSEHVCKKQCSSCNRFQQ
jgi:hypothetical protein